MGHANKAGRCPKNLNLGKAGSVPHWVPCGKCAACRDSRMNEWAQCINLELACHSESVWLTLTYNEEHLPHSRRELENDLRVIWRGLPFRHFIVSERGGKSQRIHFHCVIFGQSFQGAKAFWEERWNGRGFVHVDDANRASCSTYVAKYALKSDGDKDVEAFYADGLGPNIRKQSKNPPIGCLVVPAMASRLVVDKYERGQVELFHDVPAVHRMNGRPVRTPRKVRLRLRRSVGLPSSSEARTRVQSIRREEAAKDGLYSDVVARRRAARSQRAEVLASRARSSRVHLDPQLIPAEIALRRAVEAGAYETRAMRRLRLRKEREAAYAVELASAFADAMRQIESSGS